MKFIRNTLIALSLMFAPMAMAQEAQVCESKEKVVEIVYSQTKDSDVKIGHITLEGEAFDRFMAVLTARVGQPPTPVDSVVIFFNEDIALFVFFDEANCSRFITRLTSSDLNVLLREARNGS